MKEIVIKVHMSCDKCRAKVMKLASVQGVDSVAIKEDSDHLVVTGENVDPVNLVRSLRKKVGQVEIISVVKVNDDKDGGGGGGSGGGGEDDKPKPETSPYPNYCPYFIYIP